MEEPLENREIYREPINQVIKRVEWLDSKLSFIKNDDTLISLEYDHDQDCCEHVYADFEQIKYYVNDIVGKEYKEMVIKAVPEMGFIISLYTDWDRSIKIFIPCYNFQNGYYSDNLSLIITVSGKEVKLNVTDCVEDHID